ncbi:hypothetical protein Micbo1qcDRAFT_206830 [Microdochium bolleyi]|uniref:Uncharacterized protein n=1 Tax=Microdochium bolleyi TaxID=196109 RepID=A0A136IV39_9PEZI|nr:hypothetical protein Micbo1qcDRAFT_206830 [Microdochium bolleyi]
MASEKLPHQQPPARPTGLEASAHATNEQGEASGHPRVVQNDTIHYAPDGNVTDESGVVDNKDAMMGGMPANGKNGFRSLTAPNVQFGLDEIASRSKKKHAAAQKSTAAKPKPQPPPPQQQQQEPATAQKKAAERTSIRKRRLRNEEAGLAAWRSIQRASDVLANLGRKDEHAMVVSGNSAKMTHASTLTQQRGLDDITAREFMGADGTHNDGVLHMDGRVPEQNIRTAMDMLGKWQDSHKANLAAADASRFDYYYDDYVEYPIPAKAAALSSNDKNNNTAHSAGPPASHCSEPDRRPMPTAKKRRPRHHRRRSGKQPRGQHLAAFSGGYSGGRPDPRHADQQSPCECEQSIRQEIQQLEEWLAAAKRLAELRKTLRVIEGTRKRRCCMHPFLD